VLVASFLGLGAVGAGLVGEFIPVWFPRADVTLWENAFGRLMTAGYFGFFVFLWVYTRFDLERTNPMPERVSSET
jgi:ubiquinol-cytochrome c reductase cytochrome b subunit